MFEVVGWDLDSTVSSTMHRRHLIPKIRAGEATWNDYSVLCADDKPIEGSVELMRWMVEKDPDVSHVAISGRSDSALGLTRRWAERHGVPLSRFMLRPEGDQTPNGEWKVRCIRQLEDEGERVRLFVEDWDETARYIREHTDVPVLGINPFDEGSALVTRDQLAAAMEAESGSFEYGELKVSLRKLAGSVFARLSGSW